MYCFCAWPCTLSYWISFSYYYCSPQGHFILPVWYSKVPTWQGPQTLWASEKLFLLVFKGTTDIFKQDTPEAILEGLSCSPTTVLLVQSVCFQQITLMDIITAMTLKYMKQCSRKCWSFSLRNYWSFHKHLGILSKIWWCSYTVLSKLK